MDTVERISIEEKEDSDLDRLLLQFSPPPPPRPTKAAACEDGENDNGGTSDDSTMHAARAQAGRAIIHDEDDDDDNDNDDDGTSGHWIMPAPARRGDYLSSSLHRVPSKSILKKVSSYGNFDNDSSSIQQSPRGGMANMGMKKISSLLSFANSNNNIDSSTRSSRSWNGTTMSGNMGKKTPSSLSFHADVEHSSFSSIPETEDANVDNANAKTSSYLNTGGESLQRVNFGDDSQSIGWDLDDSLPSIHGRSSSCASPTTTAASSTAAPPGFLPNIQPPPGGDDDNDNDIINGMDSSVGGGCGGGTAAAAATMGMSRTVSFNSVNVREYDRTVGDNPSCRSGPPVSFLLCNFCITLECFFLQFRRYMSTISHEGEINQTNITRACVCVFSSAIARLELFQKVRKGSRRVRARTIVRTGHHPQKATREQVPTQEHVGVHVGTYRGRI